LPEKVAESNERKVYKLDEKELEYAKTLMGTFQIDQTEAEQRTLMVKRFVLEHGSLKSNKRLDMKLVEAAVDLISAGLVVPTSQHKEDYPLSAFALLFEAESRNKPKSKFLRLSFKMKAGGDEVRVIVMQDKYAEKVFGPIATMDSHCVPVDEGMPNKAADENEQGVE